MVEHVDDEWVPGVDMEDPTTEDLASEDLATG